MPGVTGHFPARRRPSIPMRSMSDAVISSHKIRQDLRQLMGAIDGDYRDRDHTRLPAAERRGERVETVWQHYQRRIASRQPGAVEARSDDRTPGVKHLVRDSAVSHLRARRLAPSGRGEGGPLGRWTGTRRVLYNPPLHGGIASTDALTLNRGPHLFVDGGDVSLSTFLLT
jgi:hypothetical protein